MKQISTVQFENSFVTTFEGDETGSKKPRQTPGVLWSKTTPTPVAKPHLLAWSTSLGTRLGLAEPSSEQDISILAGNLVTPSMKPYAACYAGHQFGNWAGQLGDGRAITLGELKTPENKRWELQLKGAGPTPYSRRADGRAVLRSSVREYLMSEAMHYLRVPTTRALSLVTTGEPVLRDMFYNGNPAYEPGAIVLRVAPSFLRFGNFEMPAARNELAHLKALIDYTIKNFYPHLTGENRELDWFKEVANRTAFMATEWLRTGFVHGVMNTDNMSILGLTIDYGPYSFVDDYDPLFTPNTTDLPGRRYAFGRQAFVAKWNLGCLAGALLPVLKKEKELTAILEEYDSFYWNYYYKMMGNKLGLDNVQQSDAALIAQTDKMLTDLKPDMTLFYGLLTEFSPEINDKTQVLRYFESIFYQPLERAQQDIFYQYIQTYSERIKNNLDSQEERVEKMRQHNPRFILRNYLLHQAIEELESGNNALFLKLNEAIKGPYSDKWDEYFVKRPDWASQKAGCSMLSCSS